MRVTDPAVKWKQYTMDAMGKPGEGDRAEPGGWDEPGDDVRLQHARPAEEVRTEPTDIDHLLRGVVDIENLLLAWRCDHVDVTYGFGCNVPMDKLWQHKEVETSALAKFIVRSAQDGAFRPGHSDIHSEDRQRSFEFRLCHESDMHFESVEPELVAQVITLWRGQGRVVFAATGPKASAFPKEWKRIE